MLKPRPQGDRPLLDNRAALTGTLFVLKPGIPSELLPLETGYNCWMTCWPRLNDCLSHSQRKCCRSTELRFAKSWAAGVWRRPHEVLLARLREASEVDWSRASSDSAPVLVFGVSEGCLPPIRAKLHRKT